VICLFSSFGVKSDTFSSHRRILGIFSVKHRFSQGGQPNPKIAPLFQGLKINLKGVGGIKNFSTIFVSRNLLPAGTNRSIFEYQTISLKTWGGAQKNLARFWKGEKQ
jgi:hypothetical protein